MFDKNAEIAGDSEKMEFLSDDSKKYHKEIRKLFDENSNVIFPNSCVEHAIAILIEIFRHATKEVKIFSKELNPDAWLNSSLQDEIIAASSRNVDIKIAIQSVSIADSNIERFFQTLSITVKTLCAPNVDFNFVVADGRMFRFESDANKYHAVAGANNPQIAKELKEAFNVFFGE